MSNASMRQTPCKSVQNATQSMAVPAQTRQPFQPFSMQGQTTFQQRKSTSPYSACIPSQISHCWTCYSRHTGDQSRNNSCKRQTSNLMRQSHKSYNPMGCNAKVLLCRGKKHSHAAAPPFLIQNHLPRIHKHCQLHQPFTQALAPL